MLAEREAEVSQLRAVAAGRPDAVRWLRTGEGHHWAGFSALGAAVLRRVWATPGRRAEYGGVVTTAGRGAWIERETDPCEALAALARLALDMGGAAERPRPSGGPALRVGGGGAPRAAAGTAYRSPNPARPVV